MATRARVLSASLVALLLLLPAALPAQGPGGRGSPDLRVLALEWARGVYRAPLLCELGGETRRGLRRVLVRPGPRGGREPTNELAFFELEVPEGTRCHDALGAAEPDVAGVLRFAADTPSRPDTARHDFAATLRREGGFRFDVRAGRLRVGPAGAEAKALEPVDFAGGALEIRRVERGSDAWRTLSDFGPRRKLRLTLEAPDGTRLAFDLVQLGER